MQTKTYIAILASAALIACSSEEGSVENSMSRTYQPSSIQFNNGTIFITRAAGEDAANLLGNHFIVNGTKITTDNDSSLVFPNYEVSYVGTTDQASNTNGWDYVTTDQTIRFWDRMAAKYVFTAYSNPGKKATVGNLTADHCTIQAKNADEMAGVYVCDKTTFDKDHFGQVVTLNFRNAASKVRFGIYEVINGYRITDVVFRFGNDRHFSTNCILDGSFNAASGGTYTVSYNAENLPEYTTTAAADTLFDFGTFDCGGAMGTSSAMPTWAGGNDDFHNVFPNTDHFGPMNLRINYTLISDDGKDVIRVKGAHVTIPAVFMEWYPNYAYTYLIKIGYNTNGTTGNDPDNPDPGDGDDPDGPDEKENDLEGIKPITFNVIVTDMQNGNTIIERPLN